MNEQITLTQGDSGIELVVQFRNSKKIPIDITGKTIEVKFIKPSKDKKTKYAQIVDGSKGICSYVLTKELTDETDLYTVYFMLLDENSNVTAQEALYYYVLPKDGGV